MNNSWLTIEREGESVNLTKCSPYAKGEIIIPDGVTTIKYDAFKDCKEVTSIIVPDSVTDIWENALFDTAWYKNQPDGVVYAGKVALRYKGEMPENTSITLQDGTLGIADSAFSGCDNLVSITIPAGCKHIGSYAFYGSKALTTINIPHSVVSVDLYAFDETPWLDNQPNGVLYVGSVAYDYIGRIQDDTSIEIKEGTTVIGDYLFDLPFGPKSITIPKSVTVIEEIALHNLPNLETIIVDDGNPVFDSRNQCNAIIETSTNRLLIGCKNTIIPKGVVRIEDEAFVGCSGLLSLSLPDTVTSIGEKAFVGCEGLESIEVDINNPVYDSRGNCNAIYEKSSNKLVVGCKNTVIPTGTKIIGDHAFSESSAIESITIPEGVEHIGYDAFFSCTNLKSVVFPSSLKSIGEHAFRKCKRLRSVQLPYGLKTIDDYAFMDSGVRSVSIPESVVHIGDNTFDYYVRISR